MAPRLVNRKVTVDLFRHARTTNVIGPGKKKLRVVGPTAAAESLRASQLRAKTAKRAIKGGGRIFSAEMDRALVAATGMAEAVKSTGGKIGKNPVKIRRELGEAFLFTSKEAETKCFQILEKEWGNDEVKALHAWLGGETFHNTLRPAADIADELIRKRFGLAVRVAEGRPGIGGKKVAARELYLGLASKSWNAEAVFHRLTGETPPTLKKGNFISEGEKGIRVIIEKKANKPINATLRWQNYKGDITKRLLSIVNARK